MLGILIGISAVVLTVGLGAVPADHEQIDELARRRVVSPGDPPTQWCPWRFGTASTLTRPTPRRSQVTVPDVVAVAPVSTLRELTAGTTNWTTTLTGTTEAWQTVRSREVSSGRFLTAADQASAAAVVVLGPDTAEELFGSTDAVGESVVYDGTTLEVVGVLDALSSSEDTTSNDTAIVPASTYAAPVGGSTATRSAPST
jgi:putative ABC transport system permease protein